MPRVRETFFFLINHAKIGLAVFMVTHTKFLGGLNEVRRTFAHTLVLGYGHKGRKTFGGETRIKTLIYADRSGGSGKDGGVIGHH